MNVTTKTYRLTKKFDVDLREYVSLKALIPLSNPINN